MSAIRLGAKVTPRNVASAAEAGFDYVELDLNEVFDAGEAAYRAMAADMEKYNIYAEVVCGLLPKGIEIVGGHVSSKAIHAALDDSFEAARALGAELVVFDCPDARKLPDGFDPATAWRQMSNFIRILQAYASDSGVRAVLLPMRRAAADLIRYVSEATLISAMLRLDRVGVAASVYNMAMESEAMNALANAGSLLWHVRASNPLGNRPPRSEDGEIYADLFRALKETDYVGRVTCEADWLDFKADAEEALRCLQAARDAAFSCK